MQYLLTEEEYRNLTNEGMAKRLHAEYEERLREAKRELSARLSKVLQRYSCWDDRTIHQLCDQISHVLRDAQLEKVENKSCAPGPGELSSHQ
jgi:hypothetical protein